MYHYICCFQAVEDLCLHKFGGLVYDNLAIECQKQIFSEVDSLQEKVNIVIRK
jgi:hypothetical protein